MLYSICTLAYFLSFFGSICLYFSLPFIYPHFFLDTLYWSLLSSLHAGSNRSMHIVLYMCTVLVFCTHALIYIYIYTYMYYYICMCMLLQFAASVNTSRFFLQYFISLFLYSCSSRHLSAFDRCLKSTQTKRTLFLMGQCNMCLL